MDFNHMKRYSLTIGVATYNNEAIVVKTIQTVMAEAKRVSDICDVELVFYDDCSKDNTEQVVKQYQKENPNIHFYKNAKNIGYRNLVSPFKKAKNEYVWLCGDDAFLEGAFVNFVECLQQAGKERAKKPIAILARGVITRDILAEKPTITYCPDNITDEHVFYKDFYELGEAGRFCIRDFSFISTLIIRKDEMLAVLDDISYDTQYPHMHGLLAMGDKLGPIAVINKKCVLINGQSKQRVDPDINLYDAFETMTYIGDFCHNYDLISAKNKKKYTKFVFLQILNYCHGIKRPQDIVAQLLKIDFFPTILLWTTRTLSKINMNLAFKFIVAFALIYSAITNPIQLAKKIIKRLAQKLNLKLLNHW